MISDQDIKDANLSSEDVIRITMKATGSDRVEAQFILDIEAGKIEGDVVSDIHNKLKPIIDNAPEGDQAIGEYLIELVAEETISIDDVTFLLDNKEMFEDEEQ